MVTPTETVSRREDGERVVVSCKGLRIELFKASRSARISGWEWYEWLDFTPQGFEKVLEAARSVETEEDLEKLEHEIWYWGSVSPRYFPEGEILPSDSIETALRKTEEYSAYVDLTEEQVKQLNIFTEPRAGRLVIYNPEGTDVYEWKLYVDGKLNEVVTFEEKEHVKRLRTLLKVIGGG